MKRAIVGVLCVLGIIFGIGKEVKANIILWADDISIDTEQNLMWEVGSNGGKGFWNVANTYCESLNLGGFDDWRLPTCNELLVYLYDIEKYDFLNRYALAFHWSSTQRPGDPSSFAAVHLDPDYWLDNSLWAPGIVGPNGSPACRFYFIGVRSILPGDTTPVPIPSAVWLLGSELIAFIGARKKSGKGDRIKNALVFFCLITLVLGIAGTANAALINRGGGLIYDSDQNITWLQDANLAVTETFGVSGIDSLGRMDWYTTQEWIAAMNMTNYKGWSDWRLPQTLPVNGSAYDYNSRYDGSTDNGYNVSAPGSVYEGSTGSEMAYMYHNNLSNKGYCDFNGDGPQPGWGLQNSGPFINITPALYWSGTEYGPEPGIIAFCFGFGLGDQYLDWKDHIQNAWAVRDGDVSAVPIPSSIWLLGSGLIGVIGFGRKLKNAP